MLDVTCVLDVDWKTFECIRANGGAGDTALIRQSLDHFNCQKILADQQPEILLGNICGAIEDQGLGERTAHIAQVVVEAFISSRTQILVMECPVGFAGTDSSHNGLQPQLTMAGCETNTASLTATAVGIPTSKRRCSWSPSKRNVTTLCVSNFVETERGTSGARGTFGRHFSGTRGVVLLETGAKCQGNLLIR